MKITIEQDDGTAEVYLNITEALVVYRSSTPVQTRDGVVALLPETKSRSWFGAHPRELVKEASQALDELRVMLREYQRGDPK